MAFNVLCCLDCCYLIFFLRLLIFLIHWQLSSYIYSWTTISKNYRKHSLANSCQSSSFADCLHQHFELLVIPALTMPCWIFPKHDVDLFNCSHCGCSASASQSCSQNLNMLFFRCTCQSDLASMVFFFHLPWYFIFVHLLTVHL